MAFSARGVSGELRKGYQTVARLGSWTLDGVGRLEAEAVDRNAFQLDQGGPFQVRLHLGSRVWVWRDVDLISHGTPLVLRAPGAPEQV